MMKDKWKNNLGLKIMAVLFSVFLWWTVVNIDDPVTTGRFQVEVIVTNPEVITNAGKSYQIVDNTKNVTVTVKARRKVLDAIKTSDIIATADLREMQGTSVPIRITISGFEGDYEEASANPQNLQVATEDTQKKTFPIVVATSGEVRDGFVIDKENTVALPQSIDISGPQSTLGRISRVVAKVDVSELSQDKTLKAELIYYDSADNIIDKSLLTSNCDINGVSVDVKLLRTRNIEVRFDTSGIIPGDGYVFSGIEVEPQTIKIAGKTEVIGSLQYIEVGSEALKKEGIVATEEVLVNITSYLPEGISLADETAANIVVTITMEKAGTKSLSLPVGSVKKNNVSDEFDVAYGPAQAIELQFEGPNDVLQNLTLEKIIATIDLSEYKEEGTYDVGVQVIDLPDQCKYVGKATIQVTLTKKDNSN